MHFSQKRRSSGGTVPTGVRPDSARRRNRPSHPTARFWPPWAVLGLSGWACLLGCPGGPTDPAGSGGRELSVTLACSPYDREAYGYPAPDAEGCRNTRARVLIAQTRGPLRFADSRQCQVAEGLWVDPYSGDTLRLAAEVEIDHVVPLKEAHRSGAFAWSADRKRAFANDETSEPGALLAVAASQNRAKSDSDPAEWLPARDPLGYALRWEAVKRRYGLAADSAEWRALATLLRRELGRDPLLEIADRGKEPVCPDPS